VLVLSGGRVDWVRTCLELGGKCSMNLAFAARIDPDPADNRAASGPSELNVIAKYTRIILLATEETIQPHVRLGSIPGIAIGGADVALGPTTDVRS